LSTIDCIFANVLGFFGGGFFCEAAEEDEELFACAVIACEESAAAAMEDEARELNGFEGTRIGPRPGPLIVEDPAAVVLMAAESVGSAPAALEERSCWSGSTADATWCAAS